MLIKALLVGFALLPIAARAEDPPTILLNTQDVGHVIQFLNVGGSWAEARDLAAKLIAQTNAYVNAQKAKPADEKDPK